MNLAQCSSQEKWYKIPNLLCNKTEVSKLHEESYKEFCNDNYTTNHDTCD